jgi:cell division topological specificity factor
MRLGELFARRRSAKFAQQRLQILLTHERSAGGQSDLIPILREEVLAVIGRHVAVDPDKVRVTLDRGEGVTMLEIDIEMPTPIARKAPLTSSGHAFVHAAGRGPI